MAARLAVKARSEAVRAGVVAGGVARVLGCLPPICESHRPGLTAALTREGGQRLARATYAALAAALIEGGADELMAESMTTWQGAVLAVEACTGVGKPIVLAFEGAPRGEQLQEHPERAPGVVRKVLDLKRAAAGGAGTRVLAFNCAPPEAVLACLEAVAAAGLVPTLRAAGIALGAWCNINDRKAAHSQGFNVQTDKSQLQEARARPGLHANGCEGYARWVERFVAAGASFVGGCCGCGPDGIATMRDSLPPWAPY